MFEIGDIVKHKGSPIYSYEVIYVSQDKLRIVIRSINTRVTYQDEWVCYYSLVEPNGIELDNPAFTDIIEKYKSAETH